MTQRRIKIKKPLRNPTDIAKSHIGIAPSVSVTSPHDAHDKLKKVIADMTKKENELKDIPDSELSPKDLATKRHEPWVGITNIEVDETNLMDGNFELEWNDIFISKLLRAGYTGKTDNDIVDQWFKQICQNVVNEIYEQSQADPTNRY